MQFGEDHGDSHVLTVAVARLVDGEPVPVEHDQLRWLAPEELGDVDWLEPDRPFLGELRELLLDGERLEGGNVGGAVRIGATVRRPVGPWSPAVHALLDHLNAAGWSASPACTGTTRAGARSWTSSRVRFRKTTRPRYRRTASWRSGSGPVAFHDAVAGFQHDGPWRFLVADEPTLVAHNDIAPYNIAFDGERVVGVFDWDTAGPSTPLLELAHVAWNCIPMWSDLAPELAAERLEILAAAYGRLTAREILHAVVPRTQLAV